MHTYELLPHLALLLFLGRTLVVIVQRRSVSMTVEDLHQSTEISERRKRPLQCMIRKTLSIVEANSVDTERKQLR